MQTYNVINNELTGAELPGKIYENLQSLKSEFSGTSFPTENLVAGMKCYRTDEGKVYRLMPDLNTWEIENNFSGLWEDNEQVKVGDVRYLSDRKYAGYVLECIQAGTTGNVEPVVSDSDVDNATDLEGFSGTLQIVHGGHGATTVEGARANLGLGSVATENIVPVIKGGTGATTAEGARKNLNVNIQTFTEFSQLGLTATTTELEITAAMPFNSVFIQGVNKTNNPNLQVYSDSTVASYGRLIITKISSNNFIFEYFGSEGGGYWFATGNSSVTKLKYYKSFVLDNGYVTKNLLFNNNAVIINNKKDYYLGLFGDSKTWDIGALLALYGSEHSTNAGNFILRARSSKGNYTLQGKPDGSLTWNSKGIALEGSLSMPSSNRINLSLASGDTYTAPADGWLFLRVTAPSSSTYCDLIVQNTTSGIQTRQRDNQGLNLRAYVPLAKGQVGNVEYTNGTLHTAIFVYAQSEV